MIKIFKIFKIIKNAHACRSAMCWTFSPKNTQDESEE